MAKKITTEELLMQLPDFAGICKHQGKNEADYDVDKGKDAEEKVSICLRRLRLIYKPFNRGKKVDLTNTGQWKHYPWVRIEKDKKARFGFRLSFGGCVSARGNSFLGARPYLLDENDVRPVFEQFREEHEQLMYWDNIANQE